jgi:hypothetical protein
LGDLIALIDPAPVSIGNRVWIDVNVNGVQDANEPPVAGVKVDLFDALGRLLAVAVTDASGQYYFSNDARRVGENNGSQVFGVAGMTPDATFVVRIDPSNFVSGGPLAGFLPTPTGVGLDASINSKGVLFAGGVNAFLVTGDPGTNDTTIDFGFFRFVSPFQLSKRFLIR